MSKFHYCGYATHTRNFGLPKLRGTEKTKSNAQVFSLVLVQFFYSTLFRWEIFFSSKEFEFRSFSQYYFTKLKFFFRRALLCSLFLYLLNRYRARSPPFSFLQNKRRRKEKQNGKTISY